MTRPKVLHEGFLIPNASDVSNPRMAEPDRVDFNTLAHPRWGVVEGCEVTVTGLTAQVSSGTVLVNGEIVSFNYDTGGLTVTSQDRFDLVAVKRGGTLVIIPGDDAVDPVFPDPPLDVTVLAAVFAPGNARDLANNVIDKRKFISKSLLTKIAPAAPLIQNLNGAGNHFLVNGAGTLTWGDDTWLTKSGAETLRVHSNLTLDGTITAGGNIFATGYIDTNGQITGSNLRNKAAGPTGTADPGTIWQNRLDGKLYVYRSNAWKELASIESANPPGTVIFSFETPAVMANRGWLPLNGQEISQNLYPSIFGVDGMQHLIDKTISPAHPYWTMRLPNANQKMLMVNNTVPAGFIITPNQGNMVTLKTTNLPRHGHSPKTSPAGGANPDITVGRDGQHAHETPFGGQHVHKVTDQGHAHDGFDYAGLGGTAMIGLVWGGKNKIDAEFNDRNHTYSVDALQWTSKAYTGISIDTHDSEHTHEIRPAGEHVHGAWLTNPIKDHNHDITEIEVGNGTPFNITPDHMTIYAYVRT